MIRLATPADIPALIELENSAPEAAHWSPSTYSALFSPAVPRMVVVAESEGNVDGFLVARGGSAEWAIENIVVAQNHRRTGLATLLLNELLTKARSQGAKALFLEVRESNAAARGFYERSDFRQTGRRPGYYRDPHEDALVYERKLQ